MKLTVYYPTSGEGAYYWGALDADIVQAAGKLDSSRGTDMSRGTRFLVFIYSSEATARNARKRVLALHRKGLRTEVTR